MIAGIAAVASIATVFAFAPATHAIGLDNINLGTTLSSQDGDKTNWAGLRIASQDGLENLGIGTSLMSQDGDESRGLNLGLEAVDHLENLGLG